METKTTVTIDKKHGSKLDKLCKANQCTKKDFVCAAITYFEKHGINPLSHESPAQEMQKLIKRVDQVVAFIKTQEKEILRPVCEAVFASEERIKLNLDKMLSKQDIKLVSDKLQFVLSDLSESKKSLNQSYTSQEQGFQLLARLIDAKNKTTILNDLSKTYNK